MFTKSVINGYKEHINILNKALKDETDFRNKLMSVIESKDMEIQRLNIDKEDLKLSVESLKKLLEEKEKTILEYKQKDEEHLQELKQKSLSCKGILSSSVEEEKKSKIDYKD